MFSSWSRLGLCGLVWAALSLLFLCFQTVILCSVGLRLTPTRWTMQTSRATVCLMSKGTGKTHIFILKNVFINTFKLINLNFRYWLVWYLVQALLEWIYNKVSVLATTSELCLCQSLWIHNWCVPGLSPRRRLLWHRLHWDSLRTLASVFPNWPWYVFISYAVIKDFWWIYLRRP